MFQYLTVSEITANLHFQRPCHLRLMILKIIDKKIIKYNIIIYMCLGGGGVSCHLKIEIFKSCYFVCSLYARLQNQLQFALSVTVSEITANLRFHVTLRGHVTPKSIFSKVVISQVVNLQGLKKNSVSVYLQKAAIWLPNGIMPNRVLRNHCCMMPVKFQSIISKHMACIDVTRIC